MLVLVSLSLITTWGGFVWLLKYLLLPFRLYVGAIGTLNFASVDSAVGIVGLLFLLASLLLLSRFVLLKKSERLKALSITASVGIVVATIVAHFC